MVLFLFVVTHAPCGNNCSCYHNQTAKANIYNCSEGGLTQLPAEIQNGTNWIVARHNSIKKLCQPIQFTEDVTRLNLSSNNIEELCPEFTSSLAQHKSLKYLDLSFNKLKYLPKNIQDAKHFTKILINHNDFICDCSMVWMIDWVSNFTLKTPGKEHVIQDYTNITCSNGVLAGKPIYELNRVDLGCFPDRMPSWEIGLLASAGIVVICVGVAVFVLLRRRNQVKYWLYKRFDILDKGCDGENLDGKEFDAFLSYRSEEIMKAFIFPIVYYYFPNLYEIGPNLFFKYFFLPFGTGLFYPLRVLAKVQFFLAV